MSRCTRSFFLFAAVLLGLLSPVTGLDDATAAATVWDPPATLDDPDVDPVSPNDHLIPPHTDPILAPCCVPKATLGLLGQVLPSKGPCAAQPIGLSFRIPRAPPVS